LKRKLSEKTERDGQDATAGNLKFQSRVSIKPAVWRHMELVFKSQRDLCESLHTTAKTWRDMKSVEEGVRDGTAQHVLIDFISVLRSVAEGDRTLGSKIHIKLVPALDKIYASYLTNLKFEDLLDRVEYPEARTKH
jgi:hypothetical protein